MDDTKASLLLTRRLGNVTDSQGVSNADVQHYLQQKFRYCKRFGELRETIQSHTVKNGRLQFVLWLEIVNSFDVLLDEFEIAFCEKRFVINEEMYFMRLFETLDILPPSISDEPDLFADHLPQPYRMIAKIIEMEIFDPAWLEITRLHKDLLLNSDGQRLYNPRNHALSTVCTPTTMLPDEPFNSITSFASCDSFLLSTLSTGTIIVTDVITNEIIKSLHLANAIASTSMEDSPKPAQTPISELWIASTSAPISVHPRCRVVRSVVCQIVEVIEQPIETDAGKKPPAKKGGAQQPTEDVKVFKLKVSIIDVIYVDIKASSSPSVTMKLVGEGLLNLPASTSLPLADEGSADPAQSSGGIKSLSKVNTILKLKENISVDVLAASGDLVLISSTASASLFSVPLQFDAAWLPAVLQLRPGDAIPEAATDNELIVDKTIDPSSATGQAEVIQLSALVTVDATTLSALTNQHIWRTFLVKKQQPAGQRTKPTKNTESTTTATTASSVTESLIQSRIKNVTLGLLLSDANEWMIVGFDVQVAAPAPAASVPKGKTAVATDISPLPESAAAYKSYLLGKWKLASPVSVYAFDARRSVLAMGLQDGSLLLWNLVACDFISFVGKHEAAITSLSITTNASTSITGMQEEFIASGSNDGTLCLYRLRYPLFLGGGGGGGGSTGQGRRSATTEAWSQTGGKIYHTAEFIEFRSDTRAAVVAILTLPNSSTGLVCYRDGTLAVYDLSTGALLGSIALYVGLNARQIESRLLTEGDIERDSSSSIPSSLSQQPQGQGHRPGGQELYNITDLAFPGRVELYSQRILASITNRHFFVGYLRDGKQITAQFTFNRLLSAVCPGIALILDKLSEHDLKSELLYAHLDPEQRMSEAAAEKLLKSMSSLTGSVSKQSIRKQSSLSEMGPTTTAAGNKTSLSRGSSVRGRNSSNSIPTADSASQRQPMSLTKATLEMHEQLVGATTMNAFISRFINEPELGNDEDPLLLLNRSQQAAAAIAVPVLDSLEIARRAIMKAKQERQDREISVQRKLKELSITAGKFDRLASR